MFILLTRRKATEALIHKVSIATTCQDVVRLKLNRNMTKTYNCLPRLLSKGQCLKCLSQGHNGMARVCFEPRPCRSESQRSNYSTTLPTQNSYKIFFYFFVRTADLKLNRHGYKKYIIIPYIYILYMLHSSIGYLFLTDNFVVSNFY